MVAEMALWLPKWFIQWPKYHSYIVAKVACMVAETTHVVAKIKWLLKYIILYDYCIGSSGWLKAWLMFMFTVYDLYSY